MLFLEVSSRDTSDPIYKWHMKSFPGPMTLHEMQTTKVDAGDAQNLDKLFPL
jgi:hypothetical protein